MFRYPYPYTPGRFGRDRDDDPDLPDPERAYIAIRNLQTAAELARSPDGLEQLGLGADAASQLALVRKGLPDPAGPVGPAVRARRILMVSTAGLFGDALNASYLPSRDASILRKIAEICPAHHAGLDSKTKQGVARLRDRLQGIQVVVERERLRFRNQIPGIQVETSIPARTDGVDIPPEGIAFRVRQGLLHNIFAARSYTIGGPKDLKKARIQVSELRKSDDNTLVFCRYDPVTGELELFLGSARLAVGTHLEVAPDVALSSLATDAPRRLFPATVIADVTARARRLGKLRRDVVQQDGYIVGQGEKGIVALRLASADEHELAIPEELAVRLGYLFRRIRDGCTIRSDAKHNYVEKGPTTLSFPVKPFTATTIDDLVKRMEITGSRARIERNELFMGYLAATSMTGYAPDTVLRATIELKDGLEPTAVQTFSLGLGYGQGVCTTTVPILGGNLQLCRKRLFIDMGMAVWPTVLAHARTDYLDLIVDRSGMRMLVKHQAGENVIYTFFPEASLVEHPMEPDMPQHLLPAPAEAESDAIIDGAERGLTGAEPISQAG